VDMWTPVCMLILHVQTCSSLNEVEQHVVRGSIGLADTEGAGTPLAQGQDIPLTAARREEGGKGRERARARQTGVEILKRRFAVFLFSLPISSLPSLEGCERAEQRGRRRERETKRAKQM